MPPLLTVMIQMNQVRMCVCVVVQFYPWFKFYFLLFLVKVMYDNKFETKENIIQTKKKVEPRHTHTHRYIFFIIKFSANYLSRFILDSYECFNRC